MCDQLSVLELPFRFCEGGFCSEDQLSTRAVAQEGNRKWCTYARWSFVDSRSSGPTRVVGPGAAACLHGS